MRVLLVSNLLLKCTVASYIYVVATWMKSILIMQNVEKQFDGIKPEHSRDFLMHNGQHLGLEFEKPEPSSEWSVTINQEKVRKALKCIHTCIQLYSCAVSDCY